MGVHSASEVPALACNPDLVALFAATHCRTLISSIGLPASAVNVKILDIEIIILWRLEA